MVSAVSHLEAWRTVMSTVGSSVYTPASGRMWKKVQPGAAPDSTYPGRLLCTAPGGHDFQYKGPRLST